MSEESQFLLNPEILKYLAIAVLVFHLGTFVGGWLAIEVFNYYNNRRNILKKMLVKQLRRRKTVKKHYYEELKSSETD